MLADSRSLIALVCCVLALAGTVLYSVHHPETGDDLYETQVQ